MFITTTEKIDGREIVENKGLVFEDTVFSFNMLGVGADADLESTKQRVLKSLMEKAKKLGANAIIGFRFEISGIGNRSAIVSAYGTAVVIK